MHAIDWEDRDGVRWIQIEGELDQDGCRTIEERFTRAVEEGGGDVVVLLQGVPFMATSGIRLLIQAHQSLKPRGRKLKISGLQPKIREVFETMNLHELFEEV
ncbi:MAG: STAS domain-containing protein [Planctomycetota bacterium]